MSVKFLIFLLAQLKSHYDFKTFIFQLITTKSPFIDEDKRCRENILSIKGRKKNPYIVTKAGYVLSLDSITNS